MMQNFTKNGSFLYKAGSLLIDLQEWYRSTNNIDPMVQNLFSENASNVGMIPQDDKYWLLVIASFNPLIQGVGILEISDTNQGRGYCFF